MDCKDGAESKEDSDRKSFEGEERKSFEGVERKEGTDGLIGEVRGVLMSREFVAEFERFAEEHIANFLKALEAGESPITDGGDHDHAFFDTYRLYLSHFEKRVEEHIVACGSTVREFMDEARGALQSARVHPAPVVSSSRRPTRPRSQVGLRSEPFFFRGPPRDDRVRDFLRPHDERGQARP